MPKPKVKPLIHPFTYEEWKAHPSTLKSRQFAIKLAQEIRQDIENEKKYGKQLEIITINQ